jgi:hypothetical protein
MALTAKQAKANYDENVKPESDLIKPYITYIDAAILQAGREGKRTLYAWPTISDLKEYRFNSDIIAALTKHYICQGFKVKMHPDPDPGHPASGPYTTIEW